MSFGPDSTNPRERRAYAHTKLSQLKHGEASYAETFTAVQAASHNRKGRQSGFAESLGKTAVLLVDWGATSYQIPGVVHHNFGGYVMPPQETERWTTIRSAIRSNQAETNPYNDEQQDPALSNLYRQQNQIHSAGYPKAVFTRIFRGEPSVSGSAYPHPGAVVVPTDFDDLSTFIGWDDEKAVQAKVDQLY